MNPEVQQIMEWILSGFSSIAVLIIAYFLKRFINAVDKLDITVRKISTDQAVSIATCKQRHEQIDKDITKLNCELVGVHSCNQKHEQIEKKFERVNDQIDKLCDRQTDKHNK